MRSSAEIQDALSSFEKAISRRAAQIEALDATDRRYLVKLAKLTREIKELEAKIEWMKWIMQ